MELSRRFFLACAGTATIGVGTLIVSQSFTSASASAETMTPVQAYTAAKLGEILLVDIRRPDEWRQTGVPENAVPIDMRRGDFVAQVIAARTSSTQQIALICARGVRSARVTHWLEDAGLTRIVDIPEGMLGSRAGPGWLERGLPVREVK
ncbi:rhodanese-like domain-containing protein [Shimia sp. R10_1]|uniref:rhodanese-like domain-containing protein n=1 Tax=Shimia sp. R10_1 TaxID=2821095 RepID=UPI001AD97B1F|nr:rhodanese-like domain-containing protein [Shimia sp. R10_1]MBO9475831.1 rhodanese-like domain-containing protein [Shimia sp. R10_1]